MLTIENNIDLFIIGIVAATEITGFLKPLAPDPLI